MFVKWKNEREKMSASLLDTPVNRTPEQQGLGGNSCFHISSAFIMGESSTSSHKSRFDLLLGLVERPSSMESSQSVKWEKQIYLLSGESLLTGKGSHPCEAVNYILWLL